MRPAHIIDETYRKWFNKFNMLTQNDLNEVENLTREIVKEEIKHLPTKDEFFDQTLKILTKLDNLEQAVDIISARQSEHSDRIEALEKIHPHGAHTAATI